MQSAAAWEAAAQTLSPVTFGHIQQALKCICANSVLLYILGHACNHTGGAARGHYVYFSPHFNGISQGTLLRLDMRDLDKLAVAGGPPPSRHDGLQALDLNYNTTGNSGFSGMFHDLDSSCA